MRRVALLCSVLLLLIPVAGLAALGAGASSDAPVEVTADRLEADDATKTLVFIGNAVATQGDVTIHAQRLAVYYSEETGDIERVVGTGDVRILQGERVATAQKAIFHSRDGKVVLTGEPKVTQGENVVTGTAITLMLDEKSSVVEGGQGGRVKAVFQPKSER